MRATEGAGQEVDNTSLASHLTASSGVLEVVGQAPSYPPVHGAWVHLHLGGVGERGAPGAFSGGAREWIGVTDVAGHVKLPAMAQGVSELFVRAEVQAVGYRSAPVEFSLPLQEPLVLSLEPSPLPVDGVVLTAHPLGKPVRYQPATSLAGRVLTGRMDASLGGVLDGEPGVAMRSLGPGPSRPVIRGFDGDRLVVLENGERMGDLSETAADHAVSVDPLALRRVEVVRGPAGLLYGSSALGGVVNLLTHDLPWDWSRGWSGSVGGHGATASRSRAGTAQGVYGSEGWAVASRLSLRQAGDLRTPEALLAGTDILSVEGAMGGGFRTDALQGAFTASLTGRQYGIPEGVDDPSQEVQIQTGRQSVQGRVDWRVAGTEAQQRSSTGSWLEGMEVRFHAVRFQQDEVERNVVSELVLAESIPLQFRQEGVSGTLTLRHAPMGPLDRGALGLAVRARDLEVGGDRAFTPGSRGGSLALFGFQELPLGPRLRLQFGLRGEYSQVRTLPNADFPQAHDERSSRTLSGSVGVNLRPTPRLEVGGQLARAHRTPTLEELFARGPHLAAGTWEVGDPELPDEVGHGLDVFVRWRGERLGMEVAAFSSWISGFVAFQPTGEVRGPSELPVYQYMGSAARLAGGEATLSFHPTEALQLKAGADVVVGRRTEGDQEYLPAMPPLRSRLEARYGWGEWWVGSTARGVARQGRVASQEEPTDGYLILEAQVGFQGGPDGRHTVVLRLDNATNALYRDHLSRVEDRGFPMAGRSLNLMYRRSF